MRIVLFGGTDLTLAVANRISDHVVGVVAIPREYRISYQPGGASNVRHVDLLGWAEAAGVPVIEWSGVEAALSFVMGLGADRGLAAGWYYMLPRRLLDAFPSGVAGVHASLLPKLRGNAPLNWAILNGETETGVSLFHLTEGLDEGPLYGQARIPIGPRTTVGELVTAAEAAALGLVEAMLAGTEPSPQQGEPSWCLARIPTDSAIDWAAPVEQVDRLVRASSRPYQGAFTEVDGQLVRIWTATPSTRPVSGAPGQVWRSPWGSVCILAGDGAFEVHEATFDDGADALRFLAKVSMRRVTDRTVAGWSLGWPY